jgi:predicted AlkP superfamily phosphohydrolase/phosphomutase
MTPLKRLVSIFFVFHLLISFSFSQEADSSSRANHLKLYWFIPDGVRAEPDVFKVFEWAKEGKLPNIARMMENGSYGYSVPVFPSHTPVNFASLLTGSYPRVHGIADGPMHIEGYELNTISAPGFRSLTRRVPAAWSIMEKEGKKVMVITTPGSTPPETEDAYVIRGRWGGWGADVQAVNFQSKLNNDLKLGNESKLFNVGAELTKFIDIRTAENWSIPVISFSPAQEAQLTSWGDTLYAYIYSNDKVIKRGYNRILFSADKKTILADIKEGEWSDWCKINLNIGGKSFPSSCKIRVIKLNGDGTFRVRVYYNNLNKYITVPDSVASDITKNVGPMMAFVDNYPPQLIYYPEDKKVFLEEMNMSFDWHTRLVPFIEKKYKPDVVIHDCYNPNQMLTSRWWMAYVDPKSTRYNSVSDSTRKICWNEVLSMYKRLDSIVGQIMRNADDSTLIVFSSDHGICAKNKSVLLNNLLAKNGYLKFKKNDSTGIATVDWKNTKAIFLQMTGIYINPNGLDGKWKRGSGKEYEKLRDKITSLLLTLKDSDGVSPVTSVTRWEDADSLLMLPKDRVGDLVISNSPGYGWSEAMTPDLRIFEVPLISGYKQAISPQLTQNLWTPFIIMGPGVKKGYMLKNNICNTDQLPTILKLMNIEIPSYMDGKVIEELIQH